MNRPKAQALKPLGLGKLLLGDALLFLMCAGLLSLTWFFYHRSLGLFFHWITPAQDWGAMHLGPFLVQIFLFSGSFFVSLCLMAALIPRLKAGTYDLKDPRVNLWFISFIFARIWHFEFIRYPIFSFSLTRILFLKSLGSKISPRATISSDLSLYDPHLITIGKHALIGMKSTIFPHYIAHGKLFLSPVVIGEGALIGAAARIAPDVSIGDGCIVEAGCDFDPKTKVPPRVTVRRHCTLAPGMLLEEGCTIPPYTHPQWNPLSSSKSLAAANSLRPESPVDQ